MKQILLLLLALSIIGCANNNAQPAPLTSLSAIPAPWEDSMISKQQIEEMFTAIREQTDWNMDNDMLWSYFFLDSDRVKLNLLANELSRLGYTIADLSRTSDDSVYVLRIEKVETHSPESLFERNQQFYGLAQKYGIQSYDGMDVGPIE